MGIAKHIRRFFRHTFTAEKVLAFFVVLLIAIIAVALFLDDHDYGYGTVIVWAGILIAVVGIVVGQRR